MIFRVDGNWSDHAIKFANRRQCVAQFSSIGRERPLGIFNVRVLNQVFDQINDLISSVAAVEIAFSLVTIPRLFLEFDSLRCDRREVSRHDHSLSQIGAAKDYGSPGEAADCNPRLYALVCKLPKRRAGGRLMRKREVDVCPGLRQLRNLRTAASPSNIARSVDTSRVHPPYCEKPTGKSLLVQTCSPCR